MNIEILVGCGCFFIGMFSYNILVLVIFRIMNLNLVCKIIIIFLVGKFKCCMRFWRLKLFKF